jgi:hypothetical protein
VRLHTFSSRFTCVMALLNIEHHEYTPLFVLEFNFTSCSASTVTSRPIDGSVFSDIRKNRYKRHVTKFNLCNFVSILSAYMLKCAKHKMKHRAIGLVLDSINRLVCGRKKTTTFRRLDLSPSSGGWGRINLLSWAR